MSRYRVRKIMDTRKDDYKIIEQGLKSSDPETRRQAHIAKEKVGAESDKVRGMRQELVDAHRSGNKGRIEEIHHKMRDASEETRQKIERYYGRRSGF